MTSSDDAATLTECMGKADLCVRKAVGFFDQDLAQEARLAMWQASLTYSPDRGMTLSSWIYSKAHWRIIDVWRQQRGRKDRKYQPPEFTSLDEGVIDIDHDRRFMIEDDGLANAERRRDVSKAVNEVLPRFDRAHQEMILDRLRGAGMSEVAERHGCTESNISLLMRSFHDKVVTAYERRHGRAT